MRQKKGIDVGTTCTWSQCITNTCTCAVNVGAMNKTIKKSKTGVYCLNALIINLFDNKGRILSVGKHDGSSDAKPGEHINYTI